MNSLTNPNSSLLQIHEFEKMNENFMKFKKNRKNSKESGLSQASGTIQSNHKLNRRVNSIKTKDFEDETSEITIGASIDATLSKKKKVVNLEMKSCENKDLKTSTHSNHNALEKSVNLRLPNALVQSSKQPNPEDGEVNYLLAEEDQMNDELCVPPKTTQCKKIAKYRRNRNVRVDKSKLDSSRNYMVTSLSNKH